MIKWIKHIIYLSFIFTLFVFYTWWRLIYERLPRDVPMKLSLLGLILTIIICYRYFFSAYKYYKDSDNTTIFDKLILYILQPIKHIYNYFKEEYNSLYVKYQNKLFSIMKNFNIKLIFFLINIFSKVILLISLVVDTFIFGQIIYFYKFLFTYFFINILNLFRLDIQKHLITVLKELDEHLEIMTDDLTYEENPEVFDQFLRDLVMPVITPSFYIKVQAQRNKNKVSKIVINIVPTDKYLNLLREIFNEPNIRLNIKGFQKEMQIKLNSYVVVYEIVEDYKQAKEKYKGIIVLLDTIFFLTWSYILVISLYTFPLENIAWLYIFYPPGNPFE